MKEERFSWIMVCCSRITTLVLYMYVHNAESTLYVGHCLCDVGSWSVWRVIIDQEPSSGRSSQDGQLVSPLIILLLAGRGNTVGRIPHFLLLSYLPLPLSCHTTFITLLIDFLFSLCRRKIARCLRKSYLHESVGMLYFFTFQYCVQKFSALKLSLC